MLLTHWMPIRLVPSSPFGCTMGTQWKQARGERPMPSRANTPQKETRLSIRVSEPEKALLMQAARAQRTNVSQFVLQASLDAAHAVLVDQTEFRLPPDQWETFCQRLDAPPKTILALRQLFSEPDRFNVR